MCDTIDSYPEAHVQVSLEDGSRETGFSPRRLFGALILNSKSGATGDPQEACRHQSSAVACVS